MKFIVQGGRPLYGETSLAGAKNAATKMMIASLLTAEPCFFENFPHIGDTAITAELCETVGSRVEFGAGGHLAIHTPAITNSKVLHLSRRNRLPILALGPLLARVGEAEVPILGGDKIGPRPVDLHLEALRLLGAEIEVDRESYKARTKEGLHGAFIQFRFPSVGATENALLGAVLATGQTVIRNAALEPEIIDLIKMLQKMGAVVELGSDRTIYVAGVPRLGGVKHRVLPDRNEAVSFACLAIATGGRVLVRTAVQEHLITFLNVVRRLGGEYEVTPEGISFWRQSELKALQIETGTHPGFMTDWQQPLAILLTQATGTSVVHETIYEDRFGYLQDLNVLGGRTSVFTDCGDYFPCHFNGKKCNHRAVIVGPTALCGGTLRVRDLRAGIAHLITALIARGESVIEGVEEIDRGYERIDARLIELGAQIVRVNV